MALLTSWILLNVPNPGTNKDNCHYIMVGHKMSTKLSRKLQLIPVLLRMEVGLPFALFGFPLSFFVSLFFAITNYFTETAYGDKVTLFSRFGILVKTCLINAFLLTIGWVIHCEFTYTENDETQIDVDKIYAAVGLAILIPLLMIICRCLFCYIDKLRGGNTNGTVS